MTVIDDETPVRTYLTETTIFPMWPDVKVVRAEERADDGTTFPRTWSVDARHGVSLAFLQDAFAAIETDGGAAARLDYSEIDGDRILFDFIGD